MKKYSDLTIFEKINFKANQKAKGERYCNLPNGWYPMGMPLIKMDTNSCYCFSELKAYPSFK